MGFENVDHPLAFKHVKDSMAVVLKGRWVWLQKEIEKSKGRQ
jgi:hypothetical protein